MSDRPAVDERDGYRDELSGLLDTTRSLMQARSREEVAELAAKAAADVLGFESNVLHLYDNDAGTLTPAAAVPAGSAESRVYEVGEGVPGEVFASGESRIVDRLSADDDAPWPPGDGGIRSGMCYPVGVHGTVTVGSASPAAFDEADEQTLALLATVAAAACTRAKREREVREAREHVERVLDRVNGLIENTVEVLVQATTREELEAGVVEQLAAADPYTFAWIGTPEVSGESLSPSAWAGRDYPRGGESDDRREGDGGGDGDNGDWDAGEAEAAFAPTFDLGGSNPVAAALAEETIQVVTDAASVGRLRGSDDADVGTAVVVPLAYTDTTYGVLTVFADDPGAFDERERVVLAALGRAVANAVNAVERGRILDADRVIELEFVVADRALLLARLSLAAGCPLTSAGTDYRSDGTLGMYLTAEEIGGEELAGLAREDDEVAAAHCIVDEPECLVELVAEESLVALVSEHGAVPRALSAADGTVRLTVELPYEAEARELFELVADRYDGTELVGYHEHERPVETRQEFRAALSEKFTDRQETALRTAFLGGFFEWPRGVDGNELADAMEISRPTYHQHLRAAQQKVFEELFQTGR